MALAFATSSIGAHHKDALVVSWDVKFGRESYSEEKIDKVIEIQRIRGGIFEFLTVCRFPWNLGLELEGYTKFLHASTSIEVTVENLNVVADQVFNLVRAFWVREYGKNWGREMDVPPLRWSEEPLTRGPLKDAKLDKTKYDVMLQSYYQKRGWDERGMPTKTTLKNLGLEDVSKQLKKYVKLFE